MTECKHEPSSCSQTIERHICNICGATDCEIELLEDNAELEARIAELEAENAKLKEAVQTGLSVFRQTGCVHALTALVKTDG